MPVRAPDGTLRVEVDAGFAVTLEEPVEEVARGRLSVALVRELR